MKALLKQLAISKKVLVIGDVNFEFEAYFKEILKYKENDQTEQMIVNTKLYDEVDVIICKTADIRMIDINLLLDKTIAILNNCSATPMLNRVNILINPRERDIITKLCMILSLQKLQNVNQNGLINFTSEEKNDFEAFLDEYSGAIAFINDDISDILQRLRNFELNDDLFRKIADNLKKISYIYSKNPHTAHLTTIFDEFAKFLETLKFDEISPNNFEFFDYLTYILVDIYNYNNDLFIYKILKDVYVFEHSLYNNIEYFKTLLLGKKIETNEDDFEFFDD